MPQQPEQFSPGYVDSMREAQTRQQVPVAEPTAPRPDLAGKLNLLPQFNALGPTRPFGPGEFVMNSAGGWSNEYSVTVPHPQQPGRFMVVPSLWLVEGKPTLLSEDQAAETAARSGLIFPTFDNEKAADAFSQEREQKWQTVPVGRSDLQPPLWTERIQLPYMVAPKKIADPPETEPRIEVNGQFYAPGTEPRKGR